MAPTDGAGEATGWRRLRRVRLAPVIAFASSVVALVFILYPGLKPDPREDVGADLEVLRVDRDVLPKEWLERTHQSSKGYQCDLFSQIGDVVYLKTQIRGHKRRSLELKDWVYDAKTGQRIPISGGDAYGFTGDAPMDTLVQPVLVIPGTPAIGTTKLFIRFELYDEHALLAIADTKPVPANPDRRGWRKLVKKRPPPGCER